MKAALALAFVVALTVPLDQLEGKGMAFRFPLFMLSAAAVPLAWRRRFRPYPSTADVLVVAPFLLDTLGNLVGFYDAYDATDDVLHTLNWVLLVAAFHAWRYRRGPSAGAMSNTDAWLLGAGMRAGHRGLGDSGVDRGRDRRRRRPGAHLRRHSWRPDPVHRRRNGRILAGCALSRRSQAAIRLGPSQLVVGLGIR